MIQSLNDILTVAAFLITLIIGVLKYWSTRNAKAKAAYEELQKVLSQVGAVANIAASIGEELNFSGEERKEVFNKLFQQITNHDPNDPEIVALRQKLIATAKEIMEAGKAAQE